MNAIRKHPAPALLLCGIALCSHAQAPGTEGRQGTSGGRVVLADLDGDGLADVALADIDTDGRTDVIRLSRSSARMSARGTGISGKELGDLDGDGRPEIAHAAASRPVRSLNEASSATLSIVRREIGTGKVRSVAELVQMGCLEPAAAGGDPLAHVVPSGPCNPVPSPVPIPYPDPGSGGTTGSGGTGGGTPRTIGDEAGAGLGSPASASGPY